MRDIEIRRIDAAHAQDARLPNEPFQIWGRMIPSLSDGKWDYTTIRFRETGEKCFPEEDYDVAKEDGIFLGAYDGETCIGVALLRRGMFRYLYLDDLKVCGSCRREGVGRKLIEACMAEAKRLNLRGVYTIGQGDNLSACLFYLKCGFEIGGFDNRVYGGTSAAHEANIFIFTGIWRNEPSRWPRGGRGPLCGSRNSLTRTA